MICMYPVVDIYEAAVLATLFKFILKFPRLFTLLDLSYLSGGDLERGDLFEPLGLSWSRKVRVLMGREELSCL